MLIEIVTAHMLEAQQIQNLSDILINAIDNNASVGFLNNLTNAEANNYWQQVLSNLNSKHILFVAKKDKQIIGTVQLILAKQLNGQHRAEITKLLVHSEFQGNSIGRNLMHTAEHYARNNQVSLLILDTQTNSIAEKVYTKLGWIKSGEIPNYALDPNGNLCGTSFFYKELKIA